MFKRIKRLTFSSDEDCIWSKIEPFALFLRTIGLTPFTVVPSKSDKVEEVDRLKFKFNHICVGSLLNAIYIFVFAVFTIWIAESYENYMAFLAATQFIILLPYLQVIGLLISARILNGRLLQALRLLRKCGLEMADLQFLRLESSAIPRPFRRLKISGYIFIFMVILLSLLYGTFVQLSVGHHCSEITVSGISTSSCQSSGFLNFLILISQIINVLYPQVVLIFFFMLCYIINTLLKQLTKLLEEVMTCHGSSSTSNLPGEKIKVPFSSSTRAQEIENLRLAHGNLCRAGRKLGFYFVIQITLIWIVAGGSIGRFVFEAAILQGLPIQTSGYDIILEGFQGIFATLSFILVLLVDYIVNNTAKSAREILIQSKTIHMDPKSEFQVLLFLQRFNDFQNIRIAPLSATKLAIIPLGCDRFY